MAPGYYLEVSMRTVTIKLPDGLATRLNGVVRRRSTSRSAFVREAIEAALAKTGEAGKGSCLDLARDLAGSLAGGPRDLSSNRRHLKGFGR
jgi:Arc/MetJ-type ribon-helix-helix transcriptional regulator